MSDTTTAVRCECGHRRRTHLNRKYECQGTGPLGGRCICRTYDAKEELAEVMP